MKKKESASMNILKAVVKNKEVQKQIYWYLIIINFLLLLFISVKYQGIYEKIESSTRVLVGAIVWGLTFLGLVVQGTLRSGLSNFDEFIGSRYTQGLIIVLSLVLVLFIRQMEISPNWLEPTTSTLIVHTVFPDLMPTDGKKIGSVVVKSDTSEKTLKEVVASLNDDVSIKDIEVGRAVRVVFIPEPEDMDRIESHEYPIHKTKPGADSVDLHLYYKLYNFPVQFSPADAVLKIMSNRDTVTCRNTEVLRLRAGTYRYALIPANKNLWLTDTGTYTVPYSDKNPRQWRLQPRYVTISFIADRSLDDKKRRLLDGTFSIREKSNIIEGKLRSGEKIDLLVGHTYRIEATAKDNLDLRHRIYYGEGAVTVTYDIPREMVIKVFEKLKE